ncbi:MAG: iron-containing redox enzyme family protein [Actinomycetota bacterium]|nr:iron-containing redox enzyme family protein [Actinomycetota bacterium]
MKLPAARGPLTETLINSLRDPILCRARATWPAIAGLSGEDHQLALWILYELHYQSFDDVADDCEWDPGFLALRHDLEVPFERDLRQAWRQYARDGIDLAGLIDGFEAPSLARYVQRKATREQTLQILRYKSIYQLKEADPHTWAIPRLRGKAKAALVELQFDEYGDGHAERMHAELFALTLSEAGLDPSYGAYINEVGASTLALSNVMSFFGLHRRLRGAAMGHLAAFESTSSIPCRQFAMGLRRLDFSDQVALFFDEHVEADAVHEQLAVRSICGTLAAEEPALRDDILFGAFTCLHVEALHTTELLESWASERKAS